MPTIPNHRQLSFQLMISRPDGVTWEDLTEYLARAAVEMGDVSAVGTGNTGVDGVARRLEFALRNDGPVVPGLFAWPADGTVAADRTLAADDTVEASAADGSWLARLLNQQAFNLRDSFAPRDRLSRWNWWNGQYEPLLDANREVIFRVSTDGGTTWRTEFHGYLGSRIITNGPTVTCHADDLSKPLRRKFIKEPRQYGSPEGTPVEDVIKAILNDYMGDEAPLLYVPKPTGAVISSEPEPWTVEYMSVWDAIQKAAAEIGWWLGYRWVDAAQDYVLTLMEPPTNKSTADFELDWMDDFYVEEEEITDQYVRNDITVYYRDANGNRHSVNVRDETSIAKFGEISMIIEEKNADLIRTQDAALRLANSALQSLAWMTGETRIEMPYLPGLDVFSTFSRTNPQVSSEQDFYAVHSLRVSFDFEARRFRAECLASGRVITGRSRWLRMETRPGSPGMPQDPKPPTLGQPGTPLGLTGEFSGLDAIFTWQPSIYRHWHRDKVEVYIGGVLKRTAYVANNVFVYTLDMNRQDNAIPSPQVEVRVYHEYTTGALSPPAIVSVSHPVPSAPTVMARSSSAQVHWAVTSEPPVGWRDTIVEVGSFALTLASLAGVVDAQDAGLADGQIATVSVRVRNVFNQMSQPGTAQTTVNYVDKLQFARDIKPVVLVSTLPQLPNPEYPQGSVVFLTTDNKLYRSTGTAWTAEVPTTDLSGTITETQIANDAVTTPKLKAGAVTTDKLAAGAVTADKLAANSVTAGKIAAGAVSTDALAADAVTAEKISAGAVTTEKIAAGAIDADKIAAGAIQAEHIAIGSSVDRAIKTVNASRLPNALPQGGVLFHFDGSLQSTQGLQPLPGAVATLRPGEGKFGGAVAVEEATENVLIQSGESSQPWSRDTGGVTITQSTDYVRYGNYSIKWTKADKSGTGNAYLNGREDIDQSKTSTVWTFSCYVRRADGKPVTNVGYVYLYLNSAESGERLNSNKLPTAIVDCGDGWYRVIRTDTVSEPAYVQLVGFSSLDGTTDWYFDGWQLEAKPFATSFVDGTREGGRLEYPAEVVPQNEGTIVGWFKMHPLGFAEYRYFWDSIGSRFAFYIRSSDKSLIARTNNSAERNLGSLGSEFDETEWHQYALTWTGLGLNAYVDGELVGSYNGTIELPLNSGNVRFGTHHSGFDERSIGLIDELLILPYAASDEEIRAWYELQAPFYDPTPHIDADAQPIRAGRGAVVINEEGLRGYKDGQVTFEINTSGDAWFGGDVQARTFILPVRPA